MGKWLAALRTPEKKLENAPNANRQNPQNHQKADFGGFGRLASGPFQNFSGWDADDWLFAINERAAILEYDEGLPRAEAEALAADQIEGQRSNAQEGK